MALPSTAGLPEVKPTDGAPVGDFVVPREAEIVLVTFQAEDRPPLGLDMDWTTPPQARERAPRRLRGGLCARNGGSGVT